MTAEQVRFRPIRHVGRAAAVLMGLVVLANLVTAWADWRTQGVAVDYLDEVPGVGRQDIVDAVAFAFVAGLPALVLLPVAGAVFLVWLWRARRNSELLFGADGHRRGRGWVVWGWFCPVVNLWFPYEVVDDVHFAATRLPDGLVRGWWGAFLLQLIVGQALSEHYWNNDVTAWELRTAAGASTVAAVVSGIAAVLAVGIIRRVDVGQHHRLANQPPYVVVDYP